MLEFHVEKSLNMLEFGFPFPLRTTYLISSNIGARANRLDVYVVGIEIVECERK